MYGVLYSNNCHIDASRTERGAKNYATRHGYNCVSARYNEGYYVDVIAVKINGKWYNKGTWQFQEWLMGA